MRQAVNIITGFIFGFAPLLGVALFGVVFYASFPNLLVIIIFVCLGVLTFWLGLKIFKKIQIVGFLEVITAVSASPELDTIQLTKYSKTKRRKPEELVVGLRNNENLFKGGSIRIFGDWFGKPYDNHHILKSAEFESHLNRLTLYFNQGEKLEIDNPRNIFEAPTFLKVIDADRIKFTWYYYGKTNSRENQYSKEYTLNNNKIIAKTNMDWYKPNYDLSLGGPALIIYS